MRKPSADDKTLLATSVYDALKERIMDQHYPPGDRLNIDALAVNLNVSPTPIREALARLLAEHLVTVEPYKGYRVSPLLTTQQVVDLMHVRRLIETDAARLAAQRIHTPDLLIFERILRESEQVKVGNWSHGYKHFNLLDQRFHEMLIEISGNQFLLNAWRSLYIHVELGRFYDVFQHPDHEQTCVEHLRIQQALRARDGDAAAQAVEAHLAETEQRVFRLIDLHAHDAEALRMATANGAQSARLHRENNS
jgi:DNA-binding GntR family transcriptional regulator